MITPEMIRDGLKFGAVAIIDSPNGDGAVCQIGESWFYFGGMEAETQTGVRRGIGREKSGYIYRLSNRRAKTRRTVLYRGWRRRYEAA